MRGTSGTPRHTKRSRYRCSLPGLAGFAGLRRTEPEVPRIGSRSTRKRLPTQSSTATRAKKENHMCSESVSCRNRGHQRQFCSRRPPSPHGNIKLLVSHAFTGCRKFRFRGVSVAQALLPVRILQPSSGQAACLTLKITQPRVAVLLNFFKAPGRRFG